MARNYKHEHDVLTDQYYVQGNPDGLTLGQFIKKHDSIWVDMRVADSTITPEKAAEERADIDKRAAAADV